MKFQNQEYFYYICELWIIHLNVDLAKYFNMNSTNFKYFGELKP